MIRQPPRILLMSEWKQLISKMDIKDGELKAITVDGRKITVAGYDGKVYALPSRCGHMNVPLYMGTLKRNHLVCPLHHAVFDVENGSVVSKPTFGESARNPSPSMTQEMQEAAARRRALVEDVETLPLKPYETKVEGDIVYIRIDMITQ